MRMLPPTTMLYKWPGPHEIHGDRFDYVIVPDADVAAKLAEGWKLSTPEALEAGKAPPAAESVAEVKRGPGRPKKDA